MLYSLSQTLSAIKAPIESQEVIRRASKRSKRQVTGADDRRGTKRNTTMNEFFSFFLTIATTTRHKKVGTVDKRLLKSIESGKIKHSGN